MMPRRARQRTHRENGEVEEQLQHKAHDGLYYEQSIEAEQPGCPIPAMENLYKIRIRISAEIFKPRYLHFMKPRYLHFMKPRYLYLTHSCPPFQHLLSEGLTSLGIIGAPRVPPLNPSESIVL